MTSIFERIRNKAQQAIQGVGNFIDRDPNMGGVQLAQGGLTNKLANFGANVGNTVNQAGTDLYNSYQARQPNQLANKTGITETSGIDFANRFKDTKLEAPLGFLGRQIIQPALDIPKNIQTVLDSSRSPVERGVAGLQAVGGAIPGVDDAIFSAYNALKTRGAGGDLTKGFTGEDYTGIGTTVAGGTPLETPLNYLELPALLAFGGVKAKNVDEVLPQAAKNLDEILPQAAKRADDIPPVTKGVTVTQPDDLFGNLKNSGREAKATNTYNEQVLDPAGYLEKSLPDNVWKPLKTEVFDRLNTLKGEAVDFKNNYIDQIKNLGDNFKTGSKYSELTQQLGEGVKTYDDVVAEVGKKGADEIVNANEAFRNMYDEMIDIVNANRQADGLDLINKREDYYRHISDMAEGDSALSRILSGGSGGSGPKSAGIFKERTGDKTTYDAVGGMLNYLDKAGRAGFTDRVAPVVDQVAGYLNKQGADPKVVEYLNDFSNQILGVTKESSLPGIVDKAGAKIRGSRVLGNVGSLTSQGLNIPLGANVAGWKNFITGIGNSEAASAAKSSPFLKDRGFRAPVSLEGKAGKKIVGTMGAALQDADQIATTSIWKAFYNKAKSEGVDNIIQYADDATKQITGGRGVGDFAKFQTSKLGQFLAPFTVEPQAQANKIISLIGEKKFGTLLGLAATNFLVNEGFENAGPGYRPLIDPVDSLMEAYELHTGSDTKEKDDIKAAGRLIVEAMGVAPILQSGVSNAYALAEGVGLAGDEGVLPSADDLGIRDMTRMNTGNLYNILKREDLTGNKTIDQILSTTARLIPGGGQLLKTGGAIKAKADDAVKSRKGNVLFKPSEGPLATGRQLLFGKWADSKAKELFDNDFNWGLTKKQTEVYDSLTTPEARTEYLKKVTPKNISDKQLDSILGGGTAGEAGISATFDGKSATSKSVEERMDSYKELNKIMSDDTLPQEYKDAALKASGASKDDADYYMKSAKDVDVKLQEILPEIDNMSNEEMMAYLMQGRKVLGGKQLVTSTMIDYLYDRDYIGKNERDALKALKYDEVKDEFYFKKSYSGSGSGSKKLSYSQALKAFKVDLPKFSKLKSLDLVLSKSVSATSGQTDRSGDNLLSSILTKKAVKPNIKFG